MGALVSAGKRLKFVIEGGMPRLPETPDTVAEKFLEALSAFEGIGGK